MSAGRKELGPGGRKEASESIQASKDFSRKAESLMARETFVGVKLGKNILYWILASKRKTRRHLVAEVTFH